MAGKQVHAFFIATHLHQGQRQAFAAHELDSVHKLMEREGGMPAGFVFHMVIETAEQLHQPGLLVVVHDVSQEAGLAHNLFQEGLHRMVRHRADQRLHHRAGFAQTFVQAAVEQVHRPFAPFLVKPLPQRSAVALVFHL